MPKTLSRWTILSLVLLLALSSARLVSSASINAANLLVAHSPENVLPTDPRHPCPYIRQAPSPLLTLLHASPSRTIAARASARLYCLQGDVETSRAMWEQAYTRTPHDFVAAFHLALTSYALGHLVHTHYDRDISTYAAKQGRALQTQKNVDAAQSWYEFALSLYPNTSAASYLAGIYRAQKRFEKAQSVWDDVIARLSPDTADYWWAVAQRAELDKDWATAAESYERAVALAEPSHAYTLYLTAGDRWMRTKAYDKAERAYRRALDLQPNRIDAYLRLGHLARSRKAYDEALGWYRQAQEVSPTHYAPPYYTGITLREQKRYEEALRYFDIALEKKPKAAWTWYYKALTLKALARDDEAIFALERAISLYKKPPAGWSKLLREWQTR